MPGLRKRYTLSENRIAIPVSDSELSRACLVRASPWKSTWPITRRRGRSWARERAAQRRRQTSAVKKSETKEVNLATAFSEQDPWFLQQYTSCDIRLVTAVVHGRTADQPTECRGASEPRHRSSFGRLEPGRRPRLASLESPDVGVRGRALLENVRVANGPGS